MLAAKRSTAKGPAATRAKPSRPEEVDAYIAAAPKSVQPKLRQLRKLIRDAAPDASEFISYKIPYYDFHGRMVYFAAFKDHISFFVPGKATSKFAARLKPYRKPRQSTATIIFALDEPLPTALITALVKARAKELTPAKSR
jgi:uncharacterized protein YdhG (YjbR/CyaY superfamily)